MKQNTEVKPFAEIEHLISSWDRAQSQVFLIPGPCSKPLCYNTQKRYLLLLLLSRFSRVRLCATPYTAAHQAPHPRDSPGKNTGVGCHFLLQCMKVKSESEVAQSCPTLNDPMDCSPPGSSIHGIFQARVLEWGQSTDTTIDCGCFY